MWNKCFQWTDSNSKLTSSGLLYTLFEMFMFLLNFICRPCSFFYFIFFLCSHSTCTCLQFWVTRLYRGQQNVILYKWITLIASFLFIILNIFFSTVYFLYSLSADTSITTVGYCLTQSPLGRLVIAGDPHQLGPIVRSSIAKRHGLGTIRNIVFQAKRICGCSNSFFVVLTLVLRPWRMKCW